MPSGMHNSEELLQAISSITWLPLPLLRPSSTAISATLTSLPTELLIQIFQSVSCFATASALRKTSHRLQSIWETNANAILPHVIECFPQAHDLAAAQSSARFRLYQPSSPQRTMSTVQRISDNYPLASMTCAHFEKCVIWASLQDGDSGLSSRSAISRAERADFTRAHYRALTLAIKSDVGQIPRSCLEPLDLLSYLQMREAMSFMKTQCKFSVLNYDTCPPTVVQRDFLSAATSLYLRRLDGDLEALSGYPGDVINTELGYPRPFYYFSIADGYVKSGGLARGIRMADLLTLIGDKGWYLN